MIFKQLNKASCKTYLIGSENTKEVIVVDPLLEHVSEYVSLIKNEGLKLTHVLDTHTHADHISGAGVLSDLTGAVYVMHQESPVRLCGLSRPRWIRLSSERYACQGHAYTGPYQG